MGASDRVRAELGAALTEVGSAEEVAERLCRACVELLQVDGASISLTLNGTQRGTLGASGLTSRYLDELQFTYGEGPCLDAVAQGRPVLIADLAGVQDRWPVYAGPALDAGVSAVFALPVRLSTQPVGALDLYRDRRGPLSADTLAGGMLAAELAALPLLDLMASHTRWDAAGQQGDGWTQLASLEQVEVYQATGMIMGALDADTTEALVRLRAYAFARGMTAGQAAWLIVERQVTLEGPDWHDPKRHDPDRRHPDWQHPDWQHRDGPGRPW